MGRLNKGEEKHVHFITNLELYKNFEAIVNYEGKTVSAAIREYMMKVVRRNKNAKERKNI